MFLLAEIIATPLLLTIDSPPTKISIVLWIKLWYIAKLILCMCLYLMRSRRDDIKFMTHLIYTKTWMNDCNSTLNLIRSFSFMIPKPDASVACIIGGLDCIKYSIGARWALHKIGIRTYGSGVEWTSKCRWLQHSWTKIEIGRERMRAQSSPLRRPATAPNSLPSPIDYLTNLNKYHQKESNIDLKGRGFEYTRVVLNWGQTAHL